jgi:hypothetical protein
VGKLLGTPLPHSSSRMKVLALISQSCVGSIDSVHLKLLLRESQATEQRAALILMPMQTSVD